MNDHSYHFHRINPLRHLLVIGAIAGILLGLELSLHIPGLVTVYPALSPSLSYAFPEVGLKFQRYFALEKVNCLFFGSSIVDSGLDPQIIEDHLNAGKNPPLTCMNFGLSGSMVESSDKVSRLLLSWNRPDFIIIGLSPVEFDEETRDARKLSDVAIFRDSPSYEKWFLQSFRLPWFVNGVLNRKDKDFRKTERLYDLSLTTKGMHISENIVNFTRNPEQFIIHDFHLNQTDTDALESMISFAQSKKVKVIVVEMPINPTYFPVFIEGGEPMYEQRFIKPIQKILDKNGVTLIRTQSETVESLRQNGWRNENHLSYDGAKIFSTFLASQIISQGEW